MHTATSYVICSDVPQGVPTTRNVIKRNRFHIATINECFILAQKNRQQRHFMQPCFHLLKLTSILYSLASRFKLIRRLYSCSRVLYTHYTDNRIDYKNVVNTVPIFPCTLNSWFHSIRKKSIVTLKVLIWKRIYLFIYCQHYTCNIIMKMCSINFEIQDGVQGGQYVFYYTWNLCLWVKVLFVDMSRNISPKLI